MKRVLFVLIAAAISCLSFGTAAFAAGETDIQLPDLSQVSFLGGIPGNHLLMGGLVIFQRLKNMPVHSSMKEISELIYETCKTYLQTQGKFLMLLEIFIGAA